ncbi:MAG TPA: SAM-dependent chlorinase/fluorinase [Acidimicrobiia bacterium]|nr:SAM-dependent chlorinase/fluorinase [Acidimicrobiia bacterium]
MPDRLPVVSFLSDYGLTDEFVGVCKAVILGIAPHVTVVDITHDVAPQDVRAGALALVRAVQYLPRGVVLAIVDPGVGTDRRMVAVEVDDGFLVGPDNGLLAPAVAMVGGARTVVSLTSEAHRLDAPGPTFAGRDVMAPAAAYLAAGTPLTELGEVVDPAGLVPALVPLPRDEDDGLAGEVWWVDRFGNCQLNVGPDELAATGARPGETVELRLGNETRMARWVHVYADARPSELVVLVDSYGMVSIALDRASAAAACSLREGSPVTIVKRT